MSELRIRKALDASRTMGVYHKLAEFGYSPEEIKQAIIEILEPYFEHKDELVELSVRHLGNEAYILVQLSDQPALLETTKGVLAIFRRAKLTDPDRCFQIVGEWQAEVLRGVANYWSMLQLETDKSGLELEEFTTEMARLIGGHIEASIQPLVRELLAQSEVMAGRDSAASTIQGFDFGRCVGKIRDAGLLPEACSPPPWGVSLSQWRNMGQHHSFEVRDGRIVGTYGREPNRRTITLTRAELLGVARHLVQLYGAINVARSIFVFDNLESVSQATTPIPLRSDTKALDLATAFATQGFVLEDLDVQEQSARIAVRDSTDGPTLVRSIHSSQFLFALWQSFPRDALAVEFRSRDDSVLARFATEGVVCLAIRDGLAEKGTLAETMKIQILRGKLSGDPTG